MDNLQAVNTSENNKRIAKNTMLLYMRMLLLMLVSLYTSRINLNALGVVDFGIYGVVGGVVSMFYIVSNALVGSINRFLAFEIGAENQDKLNKVFCTAKGFQYIIVGLIFILAETIGLWFLNNKLVIPADRIVAANWIYQFSTISFCLDLLVIPYTADIIAHEKMSAFAYISILTVVGKLIVAWTTMIAPIDHLIWFGALILVNSTIIRSDEVIFSGIDQLKNMLNSRTECSACGKLYRRLLIGSHRFIKERYNEDIIFLFPLYATCSKVVYTNKRYYYYRDTIGSVTHILSDKTMHALLNQQEMEQMAIKQRIPVKDEMENYKCRTCLELAYAIQRDNARKRFPQQSDYTKRQVRSHLLYMVKHPGYTWRDLAHALIVLFRL